MGESVFATIVLLVFHITTTARGSLVVKALGYKLEGRGFETRLSEILNLPNLSGRTRPWGLLGLQ
jgi:hypothetical protein